NTSRIPAKMGPRPGVSRWIERSPPAPTAARRRSRSPRPARLRTSIPAAEVATNRTRAGNHPIVIATAMKAATSASGSKIAPIRTHFTRNIGGNPAGSEVGVGTGIVYGSGPNDGRAEVGAKLLDQTGPVPT